MSALDDTRVWDAGNDPSRRPGEPSDRTGVADLVELVYSPDGAWLAGGGERDAAVMIDRSGEATGLLHGARVDSVAFSPDSRLLVTVSRDGKATMWDLASEDLGGAVLYEIQAERLAFRAVAFSPSGETFATGGEDGTVRIWNAADGSPRLTLRAHRGAVLELSYAPDGKSLASLGLDGTARINPLDVDELIEIARSRLTRSLTEAECAQYLHRDSCEPPE